MDTKLLEAARAAFPANLPGITLGAVVHEGACDPEPLVRLPLGMANRHGLIAGATGTGKTKTLQLMAEQLSAAGVPVFVADIKGDASGLGAPGEANDKVTQRAKDTGFAWKPAAAAPIELLSLTGHHGAQMRATVSSFGPLLLSKVLDLNDTQSSVLALVFQYCDDRKLLLLDFADLRAVLQHLTGEGAADLKDYGGMSKASVGVLLREMVELEQQGAKTFFGEPEFDLQDLLRVEGGRGVVSVLELSDVQDKPEAFSTFMMWMLARLYHDLPEVGDPDKPKLVFFFDEAHLLFHGASKAFLDQVEQVVRLVRSKGVGVFFITQSPRDIPATILGQLGNRVQHALRAFTPDDETALQSAARTYPKTPFYDIAATLTSLGIGEALVTTLTASGTPTPPFVTRMVPPASRMGPLTEAEFAQKTEASAEVAKYAEAVDRESARESLAGAQAPAPVPSPASPPGSATPRSAGRAPKPEPSALEEILKSPVTRTIAGQLTRGLLGALLGPPPRRRRY